MSEQGAKPSGGIPALIGLGGNIGDVEAAFAVALAALDAHEQISVLDKSALYRTPPWGDEDQDWFLNACARLETTLEPFALLDVLKRQEKAQHRTKARRWGPRTIDLDILTYGDMEISGERLEIPHPRMHERGFVMLPLCDIAPDQIIRGRGAAEWLAETDISVIERLKAPREW